MELLRILGTEALGVSAVVAPTLNVTMPAGALADSYSGTVTTSLL